MTTNGEFIHRLTGFGLSEKEAQLYLQLLKYGPKTPSPLAKSLKTYREDVHRTLTSLIDKGMVRPSLDAPTIYSAVDVDTALESAVKQREAELREMEARKRELTELSKQQLFRPFEEVTTFKIIKSVKELVAAAIPLLDSMKEEWLVAVPGIATVIASLFGINDAAAALIQRGGKVRTIIDVSYPVIDNVRELLQIGEDVRHIDQQGISFVVFDRKQSITGLSVPERVSLSAPMSGLWTDNPTYAAYLVITFEMLWEQSVPAEERIQELLEQGPAKAQKTLGGQPR
ncbi:MAG TPA: helix-turn-helix domain-containing protein [Candidatus Bathyarchaeia archaeon]|nr:helix-turn-helix domain-containing protein [Candidatus Bathyarchaeia archaeon]